MSLCKPSALVINRTEVFLKEKDGVIIHDEDSVTLVARIQQHGTLLRLQLNLKFLSKHVEFVLLQQGEKTTLSVISHDQDFECLRSD